MQWWRRGKNPNWKENLAVVVAEGGIEPPTYGL